MTPRPISHRSTPSSVLLRAVAACSEVLSCAIPLLNHPLASVRSLVWRSVLLVFSSDQLGEATSDIVQLINRIVHRHSQPQTHTQRNHTHGRIPSERNQHRWRRTCTLRMLTALHLRSSLPRLSLRCAAAAALSVHDEVLSCLVHLSLSDPSPSSSAVSTSASAAAARASAVRAKKLRQREVRRSGGRTGALDDALLARDLAEGNAEVSEAKRAKHTTATLTALFTAYFTLLKQSQTQKTHTEKQSRQYSRLLPLVMQGLERSVSSIRHASCDAHQHLSHLLSLFLPLSLLLLLLLLLLFCPLLWRWLRFAALINVDLLLDLLELLKAIINPDRASAPAHADTASPSLYPPHNRSRSRCSLPTPGCLCIQLTRA